jgi:signal peptidase I
MRTYALVFAFTAALVLINDRFFFESIHVPSSSMRPTILPNERIYSKRFGLKPISRFDIVVIGPRAFGHRFIKRVIGLPGECVQLKDGWQPIINGQPLREPSHYQLVRTPGIDYPTTYGGDKPLCLGSHEYYVLGDNRLASGDSRIAGPISGEEIQGRALLVWYSFELKSGAPGIRLERVGKMLK